MKLVILFFFSIGYTFGQSVGYFRLSDYELKGEVEVIKTSIYSEPKDSFGIVINCKLSREETMKFNRDGNYIHGNVIDFQYSSKFQFIDKYDTNKIRLSSERFNNGKIGPKRIFKYDEYSLLNEISEYDSKGSLVQTIAMHHDENRLLISEYHLNPSGFIEFQVNYVYNDQLLLISKKTSYQDNSDAHSYTTYYYNNQNQLIREVTTDNEFISLWVHEYEYNGHGNVVLEIITHTIDLYSETQYKTFEYKYDLIGNYVKKISFISGSKLTKGMPFEIEERNIKYYTN
jgi:YD repeat-containing protein